MIKPSCSKARRLVLQSEGGRIESADGLWLETHIQECATCRQESRELAALLTAWRSVAPAQLQDDRVERIEQAVLEAGVIPAPRATEARSWRIPTLAAGLAATIAVVSLVVVWTKRPAKKAGHSPGKTLTAQVAPGPQIAQVTRGSLLVYGPTGEAQAIVRGAKAPWNTTLHTPSHAGGVLALGAHATLGLAPGTQVALRRRGADTIIAVNRGVIALDADLPGTQRQGRFRVWIPGRGEVSTRSARLVVGGSSLRMKVSAHRGTARYHWTHGGMPQTAELAAGEQLRHRMDTVRRRPGPPAAEAARVLAGRSLKAPSIKRRSPTAPPDAVAQNTPRPDCAPGGIQKALARRDAMGALRTLEACRTSGQGSRTLRALEARANLQAGRVRRAYNQYLAVAHSYRGSDTGQTALYSAGRIALTRLAKKAQAKRLLKHYLQSYPKGTHRANVQQMLRRL